MKYLLFLAGILLAGCSQYSDDDDLDTRPVTNNVYRPQSMGMGI
ncbi:MAG: hypothetical protein P0S94_02725 [Simkaniaceae bacterium]|nr:hypothetical protein [Simkaniaceae bacterium]